MYIDSNFERNRLRYLSKSLFISSKNAKSIKSINTNSIQGSISLYDFIKLTLEIRSCCGSTEETMIDDLLIPLNMFSTSDKNTIISRKSIDMYAAVNTVLKAECDCDPGDVIYSNTTELQNLYIDNRVTVPRPIDSLRGLNQKIHISSPTEGSLSLFTNDAIYLTDLIDSIVALNTCCATLPISNISTNDTELVLNSVTLDPTCSGEFTSVIRIYDNNDLVNPINTLNFDHTNYPASIDLSTILNSIGTYTFKETFTDCIGSDTSSTSYIVIGPTTSSYNYSVNNDGSLVGINYANSSNSPICNSTYTIDYSIVDSSNVVVYNASFDETTDPFFIDVDVLNLDCDNFTITSTITDCVGSDTDTYLFIVRQEPVAVQEDPDSLAYNQLQLSGENSTTCDTDLLADEFQWLITDEDGNVLNSNVYYKTNDNISTTYMSGTGEKPLVDIFQLTQDTCEGPTACVSYTVSPTGEITFDASCTTLGTCDPNDFIGLIVYKIYQPSDIGSTPSDGFAGTGSNLTWTTSTPWGFFSPLQLVVTVTTTCGTSVWFEKYEPSFDTPVACFTQSATGTPNEVSVDANCTDRGTCSADAGDTFSWRYLDTDGTTVLGTGTGVTDTYTFPGVAGTYFIELTFTSNYCNNATHTITQPYVVGDPCSGETFPANISDFANSITFNGNTQINWIGN